MHRFDTLINTGTSLTLKKLDEVHSEAVEKLKTTAITSAVKNLQMIQLQKTIMAIGMFSLFESILQQQLSCKNGFKKAKEFLKSADKHVIIDRFDKFYLAVNVLKHGKGESFDKLNKQTEPLPFEIKQENQDFFNEGDVSEVATYIKVDNEFVLNCANIIHQVSNEIRKIKEI